MNVPTPESRKEAFLAAGASSDEARELLYYAENRFELPAVLPHFPLSDEPFVDSWRTYADLTKAARSIDPLRRRLVQLAFPVETGMSKEQDYQLATRRGIPPAEPVRGGASFRRPEGCRVDIHASFAGGIGIITADDRADFEMLVQAFTHKNEPTPVPSSMGAAMISGYNNWDRIRLLKESFFASGGTDEEWPAQFSRIKSDRDSYQDRFILLSHGPYSSVEGRDLGFDKQEWLTYSRTIRLEHEYAHYFTRRVFGSMQNNLLDEMLADYAGLRSAFGYFRAVYLLLFLGLERYPNYREGGRLQNYRGVPALSDGAYRLLMKLVRQAAWNIEEFDRGLGAECIIPAALLSLCSLTLDELAGDTGARRLTERYIAATCPQPTAALARVSRAR